MRIIEHLLGIGTARASTDVALELIFEM